MSWEFGQWSQYKYKDIFWRLELQGEKFYDKLDMENEASKLLRQQILNLKPVNTDVRLKMYLEERFLLNIEC